MLQQRDAEVVLPDAEAQEQHSPNSDGVASEPAMRERQGAFAWIGLIAERQSSGAEPAIVVGPEAGIDVARFDTV